MPIPHPFRGARPVAFSLLAVALAARPGASLASPANPHATPKTSAVLAYIEGLHQRTDRKILSGEFVGFLPETSMDLPEATFRQTGRWPAYIGVDYMNFGGHLIDTAIPNRIALEYWKAGGLVEVNVHLYNPLNPDPGTGLRDHGVKLTDLLVPGSAANAAWNRELDSVAAGLQQLQDAGAVVLWRPFHEMNGGWFWWGGKPPGDFKALWRYTVHDLTDTKGLNNLLWIYSPNMGFSPAAFYPGDDYADIVGLDAYTDSLDPFHVGGYHAVANLGKPFGFAEYGPHGPSDPPGDFDYRRLVPSIESHFPLTSFFMAWSDKWSPPNNLHARELFNDPLIITREDLPDWR